MAAPASMSRLNRLRQRAEALPLDRAPLRRAGLLTLLLIGLLGLGNAFGPSPARSADRQDVQTGTEEVSAPRSSTAWTGGRVLAILFLLTGGGIAFWMHRRAGGRMMSSGSTLRTLETHSLGPGHSLRLIACGQELLLLSVASEGTTLLRHWPRETFNAEPISFASALASASADPPNANSTDRASHEHRMGVRMRGDDRSSGMEEVAVDELAMQSAVEPAIARGTLFPHRTRAPHQFDVRHV